MMLVLVASACGQGDVLVPPPPSSAPAADQTDVETFAVDAVLLGDVDPSGTTSNIAWQQLGYDLDRLETTKLSTNVCKLSPDAPTPNQEDGLGGIDNAWGSVLVPILQVATAQPNLSSEMTNELAGAQWTIELRTTGLGAGDSRIGVGMQVFIGANASPRTTTDWPVLASSLSDGATLASGARVTYDSAYVTNGTFVSGDSNQTLTVPLRVFDFPFPLVIHHAVITFVRSERRLEKGIIAGVLDTEELVATFGELAGHVTKSLCGSAFDGIADQLRQAQDILSDGTNAPDVPCNAISIGLGFTATQIANPTQVVADPAPPPSVCVDAGAD